MSVSRPALQARLALALTDPAVQADGAGCPLGLHLAWDSTAGGESSRLTLWPGAPGAAQLTCRASAEVWDQVLSPVPPVGYQSFGALRRRPQVFQIEGTELSWVQALPFLERLLETLRRVGTSPSSTSTVNTPASSAPAHLRALPHVQGRYVQLSATPNT